MLVGTLHYEVNEQGLLMKRRGNGLIKSYEDKDGYLKYTLTQDGKSYNIYVHRHVWSFFNGPVPEGMTVDHIDGDKKNNLITNLQLLTPEANAEKGNARHWVAITPEGVELKVYNLTKFCESLNLHAGHMYAVAKGKLDNHKGWKCYEQQ